MMYSCWHIIVLLFKEKVMHFQAHLEVLFIILKFFKSEVWLTLNYIAIHISLLLTLERLLNMGTILIVLLS